MKNNSDVKKDPLVEMFFAQVFLVLSLLVCFIGIATGITINILTMAILGWLGGGLHVDPIIESLSEGNGQCLTAILYVVLCYGWFARRKVLSKTNERYKLDRIECYVVLNILLFFLPLFIIFLNGGELFYDMLLACFSPWGLVIVAALQWIALLSATLLFPMVEET